MIERTFYVRFMKPSYDYFESTWHCIYSRILWEFVDILLLLLCVMNFTLVVILISVLILINADIKIDEQSIENGNESVG